MQRSMKHIYTALHRTFLIHILSDYVLIRLVLHQSVKVQNMRTAAGSEYFAVYYFIHGK
jgi:hypothetical protein